MRTKAKFVYIYGIKRKSISKKDMETYIKHKDEFFETTKEFRNELIQIYKDSGLEVPDVFEFIDKDLGVLRKDIYELYKHRWEYEGNEFHHESVHRMCKHIILLT